MSAQSLEDAVWDVISEGLQQPQLLDDEYRRRLSDNAGAQPLAEERKKLGIARKRIAAQESRLPPEAHRSTRNRCSLCRSTPLRGYLKELGKALGLQVGRCVSDGLRCLR